MFIASLTQYSDRAALVKLIYPEKMDFLLSLATGLGAVCLYGVVIAERKRSPDWLRPLFGQLRPLLFGLLLLDGAILAQRLRHADYMFNWSFGLDALVLFWASLYLLQSKRLGYYLKDWQKE